MFAFDVDAVKQALVVVDSLLDDGVCQKLKALFGNKGLMPATEAGSPKADPAAPFR